MKVIICGAGRVGQGIASHLSSEGHDVTLIDANSSLVQSVTSDLEVQGLVGHASHPDVLRKAGAADAEMIVAVTYSDEVNIVTCQISDILFDIPTKIARIRSPAYTNKSRDDLFRQNGLPVDVVISPERAVADSIFERLETQGAIFSVPFSNGRARCIGIDITEQAPLANTQISQISELFPGLTARVVAIVRNERIFAVTSTDQLLVGDRAYLVLPTEELERISELLSISRETSQRIVIVGAGNIGLSVAQSLEKKRSHKVRLIESNIERAENAAAVLKRSIVIHGDGLNPEILAEAGIDHADALIGLTDNDNINLLTSAMSKRLGAKKTIALVNRPELALIHQALDVDVLIDPRAVTVSQVLLRLRRGRILALYSVEGGDAEIAEGVALEHSLILSSDLTERSLPEGVVAGMHERDGVFLPLDGRNPVQKDDKIVLFYERKRSRQVEKLFRASSALF